MSKWTDGAPFSPVESRRRSAKLKEMVLISQSLTGKPSLLIGDSIKKKKKKKKNGKISPQLPPILPASTVLDVGIAGDTVEAILYRVKVMDIPFSVSHSSLLCGTCNLPSDSPATISSTITEILFLLRRKCPTASINLFPKTQFASTNSCIYFQVQEFFSLFVFFSTSWFIPPYIIKICSGLINSTSPQKAIKFLSGGFTTA